MWKNEITGSQHPGLESNEHIPGIRGAYSDDAEVVDKLKT